MTDAETLRAAAEVVRGRLQRPNSAEVLAGYADGLEAEDAAKLKAAELDRKLGQLAKGVHYRTPDGPDLWTAVARAVREAIEAEQ